MGVVSDDEIIWSAGEGDYGMPRAQHPPNTLQTEAVFDSAG